MSSAEAWRHRNDHGGTTLIVLGIAAAVMVVLVAGFLGIGQLVNGDGREAPVAISDQGQLTEQSFEDVELGVTKEDLQASLRPVLAVDGAILDRYDLRSPETASASCVYYEGRDLPNEALYRFCFEDDVLVDKTFVLQTEPGIGSALSSSSSAAAPWPAR